MAGRKVRTALLIGAMLFATLVTVFVYVRFVSSIQALKVDISGLQERHGMLLEKTKKKELFDYELKYINYEMTQLQKVLPPDIMQEHVILSLRRIERAAGSKMTNISFSEVISLSPPAKNDGAKQSKKETDESVKTDAGAQEEKSPSADGKKEEPAPREDTTVRLTPVTASAFSDGEQLEMRASVSFRAPYNAMKAMLEELAHEKNRVIVRSISVQRTGESKVLSGNVELTFCALRDSKRTLAAWELQLEKGLTDLFRPFKGYGEEDKVILPKVDQASISDKPASDFYLLASSFNKEKPSVLIGKYDNVNSEIFYDGNAMIDLNIYVEEQDGQFYYRTRTKYMPFPDESGMVVFFPKKDDITMEVLAAPITSGEDQVRVRLNVYNNTGRRMTVIQDDFSERVSVLAKQGAVITMRNR